MEHGFHIVLLSLGFGIGTLIWFWDSIKNKSLINLRSLAVLTLLLFALLHISPTSLLLAYHHQAQDHTSQHPCCMPQAATIITPLAVPVPIPMRQPVLQESAISLTYLFIHQLHNKSPPIV